MEVDSELDEDTLPSFQCPILQGRMEDPVILENGQTYERKAIAKWLESHNADPITNQDLKDKRLIRNYALKSAIQEHEETLASHKKLNLLVTTMEFERNKQEKISLDHLKTLLDSRCDLQDDPVLTSQIRQWYLVHQCCHHNETRPQEILIQHMEKMVCSDLERRIQVRRALRALEILPLALIMNYAEERLLHSSFTGEALTLEWIRRFSELENCNQLWWNNAQWAQRALAVAFTTILNQDDSFSRHATNYLNNLLTSQASQTSQSHQKPDVFPWRIIRTIARMYGSVQEKDVFERHYQLFLANRLFNRLSHSLEWEHQALNIFRPYTGFQWINKLDGMLKEIQKPFFTPTNKGNIDVNVCSAGYWPWLGDIPFYSPPELAPQMDAIRRSFCYQFPDRKLLWKMDTGRAEVTICMSPRNTQRHHYDFVVTTYQMLVLLVFNDKKKVTFQEILNRTGVPKTELAHHLLSLVHPKVAVVLKRPNTKSLEPNHEFMLNPKYFNKQKRVNVPLMQPLKIWGQEEEEETQEKKEKRIQQQYQIDNSICCIMMTRRKLSHPILVREVICRLKSRFIPRSYIIKKRIEALIEQEYLERDPQDRSSYRYVS